ncbi:MAG: methyl-accepting chemotaxis protein, partial [Deltaproteobacteria bacterium]|nr:methyl-accepting chemotaxis protein [Deltaproteobacteria bacterium]
VSLGEIKEAHDLYALHAQEVIALVENNEMQSAQVKAEAIEQEEEELDHKLVGFLTGLEKFTAESALEAESHEQQALVFSLGLGLVTLVLGVILGLGISRSVSRAITAISQRISSAASQVTAASEQVASTSQVLASNASEQAASIEETSSTMEEMTRMATRNLEFTTRLTNSTEDVNGLVSESVQAMDRTSQAILDIKNASDETARIIKSIDEIAFQTNLLALNAAVEAARAGDAGRGFAVVAEEVRNLASRSATAARETSELIQSSQGKAERGVEFIGEVSRMLASIQESMAGMTGHTTEVETANRQFSEGAGMVNRAMGQIEQTTQENASNSEESASASEELSSLAISMQEMVVEMLTIVEGSRSGEKSQPLLGGSNGHGNLLPEPEGQSWMSPRQKMESRNGQELLES